MTQIQLKTLVQIGGDSWWECGVCGDNRLCHRLTSYDDDTVIAVNYEGEITLEGLFRSSKTPKKLKLSSAIKLMKKELTLLNFK